jgi:hypothetical protein
MKGMEIILSAPAGLSPGHKADVFRKDKACGQAKKSQKLSGRFREKVCVSGNDRAGAVVDPCHHKAFF